MEINYYRLGKQYALRPFDVESMNSPSIAAKLFVAFLAIIVILAIIGFVQ